jgi:hypothetical protein
MWTGSQSQGMRATPSRGAIEAGSNGKEADDKEEARSPPISDQTTENKNTNVDALARLGCSTLIEEKYDVQEHM